MKSNYITDKETSKGIKLKEKLYCNILVLDNFYNNPMETRNHILTQDFCVRGNYPGNRTKSYATNELKKFIRGIYRAFCW